MNRFIPTLLTLVALATVGALTAQAGGEHPDNVTLCHASGLEGTTKYETLTVGYEAAYGPAGHFDENGTPNAGHEQDYLGECNPPPPTDVCPNLEGDQPEGTDCNPPTDVCENLPGVQPPGTDCHPPTHQCVFVGADKDGGHDINGGTNDDCAPPPLPPRTTTVPPTPPAAVTPPAVTPPVVTPPASKPPVLVKPKPPVRKPDAKPKPAPKTNPKQKPPVKTVKHAHVCATLTDGTKRVWFKGGNGLKPGCYPVVMGSG